MTTDFPSWLPALPLPLARAVLHPVFRYSMHSRMPWALQRKLLDSGSVLQTLPSGTAVHRMRLGGRPAEHVSAVTAAAPGAVLYLHGGGYTIGSPATHRSLAGWLARETGRPIYVPDYRLAPEHPDPAARDDADAAVLELVAIGLAPREIALAGDSAGGGLALALALRLRDRHGMVPAALGLIAPWADPNELPERDRDLVINAAWSRLCAAAYLGGGDPLDAGYAPLLGDLRGLPATYIQADSGELLLSQCVRLAAALRSVEVPVRFSVTNGLWHVAQLQASLVRPAGAAAAELGRFLGESLQPAQTGSIG